MISVPVRIIVTCLSDLRSSVDLVSASLSGILRSLVDWVPASEVRRPGSRCINCVCVYIYYWSGRPQGHLDGVAVAVSGRLISMVTEVTLVNEGIIILGITHTLGVVSPVFVYASTVGSEFSVKKSFYAQLQKVMDSCSKVKRCVCRI